MLVDAVDASVDAFDTVASCPLGEATGDTEGEWFGDLSCVL